MKSERANEDSHYNKPQRRHISERTTRNRVAATAAASPASAIAAVHQYLRVMAARRR